MRSLRDQVSARERLRTPFSYVMFKLRVKLFGLSALRGAF